MSTSVALVVAQMGAVLVTRPGSPVFHVASRGDLTPSGRSLRGTARTVCNAHTRRLSAIGRTGVTVNLGGLRWCARCWVRLSATARRAQQLPNNIDQRKAYLEAAGIGSVDLVIALAVARTVDETREFAVVTNLLRGFCNTTAGRRPTERLAQGRWDFEVELLRRRHELIAAERTPEEAAAAAMQRELDTARDAQLAAGRQKAARLDRVLDRHRRGQYVQPHERELLDSA